MLYITKLLYRYLHDTAAVRVVLNERLRPCVSILSTWVLVSYLERPFESQGREKYEIVSELSADPSGREEM
jgi:hypothetical protein